MRGAGYAHQTQQINLQSESPQPLSVHFFQLFTVRLTNRVRELEYAVPGGLQKPGTRRENRRKSVKKLTRNASVADPDPASLPGAGPTHPVPAAHRRMLFGRTTMSTAGTDDHRWTTADSELHARACWRDRKAEVGRRGISSATASRHAEKLPTVLRGIFAEKLRDHKDRLETA